MTLSEKLDRSGGRPAGFDYIRMVLSCGIVVWHSFDVTLGPLVLWHSPWWIVGRVLVPAFFALSGFLVAGSLERCRTIGGFLYLRAIRIFPALIVEIILAAVVLGPLATSLPLRQYFADPEMHAYLLNCLGIIHFTLPGVFTHNPAADMVNRQLWTIPYELKCYVVIAVLGLVGVTQRRGLFLAFMLAVQAACVVLFIRRFGMGDDIAQGSGQLLGFFLAGVLFYRLRARIAYDGRLFLLSLVLSAAALSFYQGYYLAVLPLTYATVFLGLTDPRRVWPLETGDYSYGIYLYGYPVQQAVVASGLVPLLPLANLAVSLPIIFAIAACSWHFWEKRMLGLRRYRPQVDVLCRVTAPGAVADRVLPGLLAVAGRSADGG